MSVVDDIARLRTITLGQLEQVLLSDDKALLSQLQDFAQQQAIAVYGRIVFVRGLIEISNICRNDCYYCGIRRSNGNVARYRLTAEHIIDCCHHGYALGMRTFVMQGGEDAYYTDQLLCDIIRTVKKAHPDCAVTLSLGERSYESYQRLREAGADRYLLRHETADYEHYRLLHPNTMSLQHRKECLFNLRSLGYQVGSGFMVGSPYQSIANLHHDLLFLQQLQPAMIGIGPFLHQHDTPFGNEPNGSTNRTLRLIALLRLLFPSALIPATTALGTSHPQGREQGILHGANVLMPNLSPTNVRKQYNLYDNKICTGDEAAECVACLKARIGRIGYEIVVDRGDYRGTQSL